jgi:peroxiredoxin
LAFYPADWSPICGDELALFSEVLPMFQKHDAELIGISVDGPWSHLAISKERKYPFPLLSDFEPKGGVSKLYNVYRHHEGTSERALFVIDKKGIIRWSYLGHIGVNPGADGIIEALENIQEGEENCVLKAVSK